MLSSPRFDKGILYISGERSFFTETVRTDVLVIGGGGAGMRAALAAKELGADVLLVSKTPVGKSTCTYLSAGAISLAAGGLLKETHLQMTLQAGRGFNQKELVETLVDEAPDRVRELERIGVKGVWSKGRFLCQGKYPAVGAPLAMALANEVKRQGIAVLPWIMVYDLLMNEGRVVGALGFDFHCGEPLALMFKTVILANGGAGGIYQRNDNPVRATGDGYALAFRAGCHILDMEFVQFLPGALAEPGKPPHLITVSLLEVGRITNSLGEGILEKYGIAERPVGTRSRDTLSRAILMEETEGRQVFLDLRCVSERDWPKDITAQGQHNLLLKHFSCNQKPLRILPMCHFFMGGVAADRSGRTEIPGLFAGGEVVGGIHGANRLGGNALGEILVFGYRAGRAAAQQAKEETWKAQSVSLAKKRLGEFQKMALGDGPPPRDLRKAIGHILWNGAGILRDARGMKEALNVLEQLRVEKLPRVKLTTPKEMLEKLEVENALLVGEMILRSALIREESRGAHYRKDFPATDDGKWKGHIFIKKVGEGMDLEFCPLA